MPAQPQDVELTTLTYGGEALGRLPDGRVVFVPFGLPGELVRIQVGGGGRGFARGELVEVLRPSPQRVAPRCIHFGTCGGCHYQHLPYEMQLQAKTEILRDQLRRIGKIENPPVRPMQASSRAWGYRNHVQFHLTEQGRLGYVGADDRAVIPISECHLPEAAIAALWPQLEFDPDTAVQRVSLRAGEGETLLLVLESGGPETPQVEVETELSVVHLFEENTVVIAGEDHIRLHLLGRDFRVSAASFFQVNTPMTETMVTHLLGVLPERMKILLDVYAGVGLFSAFLVPRCEKVIAVESAASACDDFVVNLDEFDNVELYEGMAGEVLPHLDVHPEVILVDPPRAGLERGALDGILQLNPTLLVYVSCDPSTLARDAARLMAGGYRLLETTPFDLFPQTYHIESISLFRK